MPFYVSRIDATTRRICDAGARWHAAGNGHLLSRRKITSGRAVVTAEMCLRSAVSTGHVVALRTTRAEAVVPRGCSETRGQVSMYTRLYVPGAQCKLIPFTGSQRVCRVVTLPSCRPHRQHFREKHSPSGHYILVQRLTIVWIGVLFTEKFSRGIPQINGLNTSFLSFFRFLRLEESC